MDKTKKSGNKDKKSTQKFVVDCSKPVEDKVFSTNAFAQFLKERIKVNNKTGNLGSEITVNSDAKNVTVSASTGLGNRRRPTVEEVPEVPDQEVPQEAQLEGILVRGGHQQANLPDSLLQHRAGGRRGRVIPTYLKHPDSQSSSSAQHNIYEATRKLSPCCGAAAPAAAPRASRPQA